MEEVIIKNKLKYLKENYFFESNPKLSDKKRCIHCGEIITIGEFKVYKNSDGFEFICCPNAPECNGTMIDWMPVEMNFD
jgi:hypothetical protein